MKLSDKIKAILQNRNEWEHRFDVNAGSLLLGHSAEILAAVEAMEEGRVLPRLPEGWMYIWVTYADEDSRKNVVTTWEARVSHYQDNYGFHVHNGIGPTPAAAAQAAIDKIPKDGV